MSVCQRLRPGIARELIVHNNHRPLYFVSRQLKGLSAWSNLGQLALDWVKEFWQAVFFKHLFCVSAGHSCHIWVHSISVKSRGPPSA